MLSIRSAASSRPRSSANRCSNSSSAIFPVSRPAKAGHGLRVFAEQSLDGVLVQVVLPQKSAKLSQIEVVSTPPKSTRRVVWPSASRIGSGAMADEAIDQAESGGLVCERDRRGPAPARVRADLGRALEPDLRRDRLGGQALGAAAAAAGQAARLRPRHGPRAPDHLRARRDRRARAPAVAGCCEDESVNGAPFYVMDFVEGPILRTKAEAEELRRGGPAGHRRARRRHAGRRSTRSIPTRPALGDLGKKEDYVARQLHRWHGQWEKSKTREVPLDRRGPRPARPSASPSRARRRSSTATTASTT